VASSLITADVVPIASKDIESYWRAIDTIARERKYLTLLEAFPLPQTREFLLGLMERGDPVFWPSQTVRWLVGAIFAGISSLPICIVER
jgi:hypothetical protein